MGGRLNKLVALNFNSISVFWNGKDTTGRLTRRYTARATPLPKSIGSPAPFFLEIQNRTGIRQPNAPTPQDVLVGQDRVGPSSKIWASRNNRNLFPKFSVFTAWSRIGVMVRGLSDMRPRTFGGFFYSAPQDLWGWGSFARAFLHGRLSIFPGTFVRGTKNPS